MRHCIAWWCYVLRSASTILHRINFLAVLYNFDSVLCIEVLCVSAAKRLLGKWYKQICHIEWWREIPAASFSLLPFQMLFEKAVNWYFNGHCGIANAHTLNASANANTYGIHNNEQLILPTTSNAFDPDINNVLFNWYKNKWKLSKYLNEITLFPPGNCEKTNETHADKRQRHMAQRWQRELYRILLKYAIASDDRSSDEQHRQQQQQKQKKITKYSRRLFKNNYSTIIISHASTSDTEQRDWRGTKLHCQTHVNVSPYTPKLAPNSVFSLYDSFSFSFHSFSFSCSRLNEHNLFLRFYIHKKKKFLGRTNTDMNIKLKRRHANKKKNYIMQIIVESTGSQSNAGQMKMT